MCSGLFLRPAESIGVLYIGRDGVLEGPSLLNHGFVDEDRFVPGVGQHPAVAILGGNIALEPQRCSRWCHPDQGSLRSRAVRTLLLLGGIYPYEADPPAVQAAEAVSVRDTSNHAL